MNDPLKKIWKNSICTAEASTIWKKVFMALSQHLTEKYVKRPNTILERYLQSSLFGPVMLILYFSYYDSTVPDNLVRKQNHKQELKYTTKPEVVSWL
jgi:hypothetical protein